jgi:hypothetical protein
VAEIAVKLMAVGLKAYISVCITRARERERAHTHGIGCVSVHGRGRGWAGGGKSFGQGFMCSDFGTELLCKPKVGHLSHQVPSNIFDCFIVGIGAVEIPIQASKSFIIAKGLL